MDVRSGETVHSGENLDFIQSFGEFQPVVFPGIGVFQQLPWTATMGTMPYGQVGKEVIGEA